jgi:hypothetical protein
MVKAHYGVKQVPRDLYAKFDKVRSGFRRSLSTPNLNVRSMGGDFVIAVVYVDDIIITSCEINTIQNVKSHSRSDTDMNDLGLHCCVRVHAKGSWKILGWLIINQIHQWRLG